MRFLIILIYFVLAIPLHIYAQVSEDPELNKAIEVFFNVNTSKETEDAIEGIIALKPSFETIYKKLKQGRSYSSDVTRGFMEWHSVAPPNIEMYCLVFIPKDYDPGKKYPVRVFLHGGISNMDPKFINSVVNRNDPQYDTLQQIVVYPSGNAFATWWSDRQYDHVMQTLLRLKKLYNTDENRVRLGGVSDGATGTYYFANADASAWSCFIPFIGHAGALDQLSRKQVYIRNFSSKPFFIVNAGRDHIFDPKAVIPYAKEIAGMNPRSVFIMIDSSGHNLNWMNAHRDSISRFVSHNPRNPFPDSIYWQTENSDRYNRNNWVIINKIGKTKESAFSDDPNSIFLDGTSKRAFHRDTISAIISVVRIGNEIQVSTKNVKEYSLLLSPDQFDLSKPIRVITNGVLSFDGIAEKKEKTLLHWFSIDQDRTMLFGSELKIETGKKWKG